MQDHFSIILLNIRETRLRTKDYWLKESLACEWRILVQMRFTNLLLLLFNGLQFLCLQMFNEKLEEKEMIREPALRHRQNSSQTWILSSLLSGAKQDSLSYSHPLTDITLSLGGSNLHWIIVMSGGVYPQEIKEFLFNEVYSQIPVNQSRVKM